jgi:tetratricopeptide (TPR) repeat protein/SAM-dependent methyltransferase
MLQHIQQLLQSGRHAEALQLVSNACAANPAQPDLWLLRASLQAQANDLSGVTDSCTRVLALQPNHSAARYNLAVALQSQQRNTEALEHYRTLLTHEPGNVAALNNLGALLLEAGLAGQALQPLQTAVALAPGFAAAHNTLGLVYDRLNQHAEARSHFRSAATLDPNLLAAHSNLARSLHLQGNSAQALSELATLLAQRPDFADARILNARILRESGHADAAIHQLNILAQQNTHATNTHYELAAELSALGDTDAAIHHYEAAIAQEPKHARALNNLGSLYHQLGRTSQAITLLERAQGVAPSLPEVQINLSTMHWGLGHEQAALQHCLAALKLAPGRRDFLQRFAQIIGGSRHFQTPPDVFSAIDACFNTPGVDQQSLVPPGQALLLSDPEIGNLFARCQQGEWPAWPEFLPLQRSGPARLLERLMHNTVFVNPAFELALRAARHAALLEFVDSDGHQARAATDEEMRLLTALAHQCFNNEFAYVISALEQHRLALLFSMLDAQNQPPLTLALIGALYGPLTEAGNSASLEQALKATGMAALQGLAARHFDNPRMEAALREEIRDLTPILDTTSQAVRDQYEASPYPRWLSVDLHESKPYPTPLRDAFAHFTPPDFGTSAIQTLVAGCGTGKHAILSATRFRGSRVTAVDLSRSSLAYALRKTRELGINTIEFYCGDILKLHELRSTFHIIESVGVLHHLRDPEAGLRSLRTLLAPDGLMNLGFYSTLARHAVYAARDHFHADGGWSDLDAIRRARSDILGLPDDHPIRRVVNMQDFFSLSDCRDLLFHTQERSYRIAEIKALLERAKLRFIGFELPDPRTKLHYARECPNDPSGTDLNSWDGFEQRHPETFTGMYVFWCQALD